MGSDEIRMKKDDINKNTTLMKDMKVRLSTLWIFVVLNFIYADVIALMAGLDLASLHLTPEFLLLIAIYLEIPIAMFLLSRVLKYRANRWANIIAGTITTVVNGSSYIFGPTSTPFYIFFGILEIVATLLIVWYAWNWREEAGNSNENVI